ncbi:MAG: DUF6473 family protein [Proteobacteria bacterium]|nr:DUF6473 family protein [Pseudomonadota bacterium]
MKFDRITRGSLDYCLYRHERSKSRFRGPRPDLTGPYCAFIGSTETFGKFVANPFVGILQESLGVVCANFGAVNAGVDKYRKDPSLLLACGAAQVTVIGVTGAHNLSNRFYSVHPRQNDRFVKPSKMLETLYREVDFSEIHYTRHLLNTLLAANADKFSIVVDELKQAWLSRMRTLLEMIDGKTVLLWMSDHAPGDAIQPSGLGPDPLFIDQTMLDTLSPLVTKVVEAIASPQAKNAGTNGMLFVPPEQAAAAQMPGPLFHQETAARLQDVLKSLL